MLSCWKIIVWLMSWSWRLWKIGADSCAHVGSCHVHHHYSHTGSKTLASDLLPFVPSIMEPPCFGQSSSTDCLEPSKVTRFRARPNLSVPQEHYTLALQDLLVQPPLLDMYSKLGPVLAKHAKQVIPEMMASLHNFWSHAIDYGCKNLVLQSNKIKVYSMQSYKIKWLL